MKNAGMPRRLAYALILAALAAPTGRYEVRPGRTVTIVLEGEALFVIDGRVKAPRIGEK